MLARQDFRAKLQDIGRRPERDAPSEGDGAGIASSALIEKPRARQLDSMRCEPDCPESSPSMGKPICISASAGLFWLMPE